MVKNTKHCSKKSNGKLSHGHGLEHLMLKWHTLQNDLKSQYNVKIPVGLFFWGGEQKLINESWNSCSNAQKKREITWKMIQSLLQNKTKKTQISWKPSHVHGLENNIVKITQGDL